MRNRNNLNLRALRGASRPARAFGYCKTRAKVHDGGTLSRSNSPRHICDVIGRYERAADRADGPLHMQQECTMSDDGRDRFEIPKEMRSMAEASFDQARKAFENFVASAQQTAAKIEGQGASVRAGAKDISSKAISYAEKNVQASLDYAQQLLHAKDLTEVMRLHSEFVQSQMRSLAEQASEMGQTVARAAMDAARPKTD